MSVTESFSFKQIKNPSAKAVWGMTSRTKGPRRALEHPECGRQMGDKWETNEYDV